MNDKVVRFRNRLAEGGLETTPEQAAKIFGLARKIMKNVGTMSPMDVWALEEELSPEELHLFKHIRSRIAKVGD